MPDYSQPPLIRKLGIKAGQRLFAYHAPPTFFGDLEPLPNGINGSTTADEQFDIAFLFVRYSGELYATSGLCAEQLPLRETKGDLNGYTY